MYLKYLNITFNKSLKILFIKRNEKYRIKLRLLPKYLLYIYNKVIGSINIYGIKICTS